MAASLSLCRTSACHAANFLQARTLANPDYGAGDRGSALASATYVAICSCSDITVRCFANRPGMEVRSSLGFGLVGGATDRSGRRPRQLVAAEADIPCAWNVHYSSSRGDLKNWRSSRASKPTTGAGTSQQYIWNLPPHS